MASIIMGRIIALLAIMSEEVFALLNVNVRYMYDSENNRTNQISGYVYTVANTDTFERINVFVEQKKPLISNEELQKQRENGEKIFVEFDNAVIKPYFSTRTKTMEDSISAQAIQLVTSV